LTKVNSHRIQNDLARSQQLYNSQLISKQQYDHDINALDAANVQSSIAQTQIEAAKAQLGILNNQLRNTRIVAPVSGIIAKRSAAEGEVVQPGQAIFTINTLQNVWVKANFEETKIRFVHLNHEVDIFIDAYPHRLFKGKIVQIGADIVPPPLSVGESIKTTQKIPVKIVFEKREDSKLFVPGMSVEVKVKAR
jgi:membrane fusion protein (multidrug efflux system)